MTKRSALILVPLAALLLGACSQLPEAGDGPGLSREIVLSGSVGTYTRVSSNAFDAGDEAGLFAGAPVNVTNVKITSDGAGGFTPAQKLYWGAEQGESEASSFIAYYPYNAQISGSGSFDFPLATDQTSADAYAASDFLYASTTSAPADGGVRLHFNHAMSRFAITVDCLVEGHSVNAVTVNGVTMTASVNIADGVFGAAPVNPLNAKALRVNDGFVLVLAPQKASPEIVLEVSNGESVKFTPAGEIDFASGKQVLAHLVLDMDGISSFSAEVEPWISDELSLQGETPGESGLEHTWCVYNANSGEMFGMEQDEDGIFSARIYGHAAATPLFIAKDGDTDQLFGQVYNLRYVDEEEPVNLILTSDAHYAIYCNSSLDITVFFDPVSMTASWMEVPYDWEEVGQAKFIDGFIAGLFGLADQEVEVTMCMSPNYDGVYCLDNPYLDCRWVYDEQFAIESGNLVFVIKEDDTVYFKRSYTGLYYEGFGAFYALSLVPDTGWGRYSNYGYLDRENQYISFPDQTGTSCNNGTYLSNNYGIMAITLPGGTRPVLYKQIKSLYADVSEPLEGSMSVRLYGESGLDVQDIAFEVYPGTLSPEEIGLTEPVSGLEYIDWFYAGDVFETYWECPEAGDYTAVFYSLDKEGEVADSKTVSFTVTEMDPAYLGWLGTWYIAEKEYTISVNVAGVSYLINGFVGGDNVPLSFDPETGDAVFYSGIQEDSQYNSSKYQAYRFGMGSEDLFMEEELAMARFIMGADGITARIESEKDSIDSFGIVLYNTDTQGLNIASYDDIIDLPADIKKLDVQSPMGAPARHILQLRPDAALISTK